jgi:hypothetical protein
VLIRVHSWPIFYQRVSAEISGELLFIARDGVKFPAGVFFMDRFDPAAALEELNEEARLPNPVHMRDLLLRAHLEPKDSLEMNRQFTEYQKHFGEALKLGKSLLAELAERHSKV